MKNVPKNDYAAFQNSILNQLTDRANDEAEEILQKATKSPLTDEDSQKLTSTEVAGHSWLKKELLRENEKTK